MINNNNNNKNIMRIEQFEQAPLLFGVWNRVDCFLTFSVLCRSWRDEQGGLHNFQAVLM